MKSTEIVRRIDDLGRLVIPGELRNKMGIEAGDKFELFVEDDSSFTFKKLPEYYSILNYAQQLCELAGKALGCTVFVSDFRSSAIVASSDKQLINTIDSAVDSNMRYHIFNSVDKEVLYFVANNSDLPEMKLARRIMGGFASALDALLRRQEEV